MDPIQWTLKKSVYLYRVYFYVKKLEVSERQVENNKLQSSKMFKFNL